MREISIMLSTFLWISGLVFAKGFVETLAAIVIPFYSWYLVVEHFVSRYNL
jgi:hypothetical protein